MTPTIFSVMGAYFGEAMKDARTYPQAYKLARQRFEADHDMDCPLSYEGFRKRNYRYRQRKH